MNKSLLTTAQLLAATGYKRAGDMAAALRRQGIHLFEGKDGPWTTIELVNAAGGLLPAPVKEEPYRVEDLF
jgi:hypothetical protein